MRGFTIAKVMHTIRLGLHNARKSPVIKARIQTYGYDQNRMNQGDALYREVVKQRRAYEVKRDDALRAHEAWKSKSSEARNVYIKHLKFARRVFENHQSLWNSLEMKGRRKYSFSGWTSQAKRFYHGILADEELSARMLRYNVTAEQLEQALALVEEVLEDNRHLILLQSESKQTRVEWDNCLNRLKQWYYMFRFVLRVVLERIPEFFTAVGLQSKRKPNRRKGFRQAEVFRMPQASYLAFSPHL